MNDVFEFSNEVSSLDSVPEQYRPLYQEAEGGTSFVLDKGLAKKLDVSGFKKALNAERALREQFEKKSLEMSRKLESIDPVKKESELEPDKIQSIYKKAEEKYLKELEQYKTTNSKLLSRVEKATIDDAAIRAISEEKGSVDLLLPIIRNLVKVEFDSEYRPHTVVHDLDGERMVDGQGNMSIKDLVKYLKRNERFSRAFEAENKSGAGTAVGNNSVSLTNNPWRKETVNITEQLNLLHTNPALAQRLKRDAGKI